MEKLKITSKNKRYKYIPLLVLMLFSFSLKAQPDPDMYNKQQLILLNEQINESDTINYVLHWRRANILGRMAGRFEQLKPSDNKALHNCFINDIGLLIDNEIVLEGFKAITIAHYYFIRANYYFINNEQDKAIEDYKIALEKDNRKLIAKRAYYRLLAIYEARKDYENAIVYCDTLIQQSIDLGGDYVCYDLYSSLFSKKAEFMYILGKHKELLDYLKNLFRQSYLKNSRNQDVYCFLNLYRQYYALVTPSGLSKYSVEDMNDKSVPNILETMDKLNKEIE